MIFEFRFLNISVIPNVIRNLTLFLLLCFSCKNATQNSDINIEEFQKELKKDILATVGILQTNKPYLISSRQFRATTVLTNERAKTLQLSNVFKTKDSLTKLGISHQIDISKNFKSFVIHAHNENKFVNYKLINYTNDFKFIDELDVSYYDLSKGLNTTETYVFNHKLFVYNKDTKKKVAYNLNENGKFSKQNPQLNFNFLELKDYKYKDAFTANFEQRVVKAKNGLLIRDSLGNKIGKLNYLEPISVLNYSKEKLKVSDQGKTIIGRKAKIIISTDTLKQDQNFYIEKSNMGYVFDGFLFDNSENEDEAYRYEGLTINKNNLVPFNLKELFNVKQVKLKDYLNRVIKTPNIQDVTKRYKNNKLVTIKAENGKRITFKDTTYNSEYSPTKTFSVSEDSNFKDRFVVGASMIFSYQEFQFVSKKNGEILDTYSGGYPHVSPNKDYVISIDYDAECPNQRTLFIDKIVDNKIIKIAEIYYHLENYEHLNFVKNTNKNEVFWLSDTEFIIKFWGAEECYSDSDDYFYYKYKIKPHFLEILRS